MRVLMILLLALTGSAGLRAADTKAQEAAAEAERLRGQALAQRDGNRLRLDLLGGLAPRILLDKPVCDRHENCLLQRWMGLRIGQRFHEIRADFYEGDRWLWIDRRSGLETAMEDRPRPAPGEQHVLVVNESEAYQRNGLWLWAVTDRGLSLRYAYEDAPFRLVSWESPTQALVLRLRQDPKRCPGAWLGQAHRLQVDAARGGRLERLKQAVRCVDLRTSAQGGMRSLRSA